MTAYCCEMMERYAEPDASGRDPSVPSGAVVGIEGGGFGLIARGGGRALIEIAFCPWCGAKLPPIQDLSDCP